MEMELKTGEVDFGRVWEGGRKVGRICAYTKGILDRREMWESLERWVLGVKRRSEEEQGSRHASELNLFIQTSHYDFQMPT